MTAITPHLWYDKEAQEAAKLYTSIFDDSEILSVRDFGDGFPVGIVGLVERLVEVGGAQESVGHVGLALLHQLHQHPGL